MFPVYQIVIGSRNKKRKDSNKDVLSDKQIQSIEKTVRKYVIGYSYDKRNGYYNGQVEECLFFTIISTAPDKLIKLCSKLRQDFNQHNILFMHTGVAEFIDRTFVKQVGKVQRDAAQLKVRFKRKRNKKINNQL